jgi:ribosomal protein S18 acetylase RimI-like enzyme
MMMHIRPIQRRDQTQARALIESGLAERWGFLDSTCNPDLTDLYAHYVQRGHRFYVGDCAGVLVATGALTVTENSGRIERVSVASDWRRRGFGRIMTNHLIDTARTMGLAHVMVETNHDWRSAVALYRACGFVPYDSDSESVYLCLPLMSARTAL